MGKKKSLSTKGAERLEKLVTEFENTDKGRHDRKHFGGLIVAAVEERAFTMEDAKSRFGKVAVQNAFQGASTGVPKGVRNRFIADIRSKTDLVLAKA